ncbi:FAD-dependent oxidoreductase [Candidatus Caldatribacterium saccharofermentans]|uniref:NAD(P)/FAD-dependent oxidoreductase n=1 Tax=Candidatus Caldatribacterium saccharofermentans TaxID=1454753 RepID=A0A7V4U064_9BACT
MSERRVRYLLVGFSVASWWAARSIQEEDVEGQVLAVSEDEELYSRPLITYALGRRIPGPAYWGDVVCNPRVTVLWGRKAVALEAEERVVHLDSGERIVFDRALIATGSVPIVPSVEGKELEGVFTFTRGKDLLQVERFLARYPVEEVLILGGGFIGLKTCEAFLDRGFRVTLVELAPCLLPAMLDTAGSKYLERALKQAGVRVITENTVASFVDRGGRLFGARLQGGEFLRADLAILAIGVRPNIEWLLDSGLSLGRGIMVDEHQETSVQGIFAAGDVAETRHYITGERTVVAIWPEAVRQGKVAGKNMAGRKVQYPGSLPLNVVEIGDVPLASCGVVNPPDDTFEVLSRSEGDRYRKFVLLDGRLVGFVLVGDIEKAGLFVHLIRERLSLHSLKDKLLDERFGLIALPAEYRKHLVQGAGVEA